MPGIFNYPGRNFYPVAAVNGDKPAVESPVQVRAQGYAVADGIVMGEAERHNVA